MSEKDQSKPNTGSYTSELVKALLRFGKNGTTNPDTSNLGSYLGEAFMWDYIESYAKKQSDTVYNKMEKEGLYDLDTLAHDQEHVVLQGKLFTLTCRVSQPVKRFNPDALALAMNKKYKIPLPVAKQMIEDAKLPTKPTRTLKIIEKAR